VYYYKTPAVFGAGDLLKVVDYEKNSNVSRIV
jgi:hypothetical protein